MFRTLHELCLIFSLVIISAFITNINCCDLANAKINRPAAVTDLAPADRTFFSAALTWTSPEIDGDKSKVFSYDIRYSESVITRSNWDSANQALGEPIPVEAGKSQSMTIIDLSAKSTYYFALKTQDNLGNISKLSNVINITTLDEPTKTFHLTKCGSLTQPDTYYILDNDVTCGGTCFTINATNVILDLNGHTIIYDDFPSGLPNADFEFGDGTVPSNWDLRGAPAAKRTATTDKVMVNKWYLKFENPETSQTIVSPWINLPKKHDAVAYLLKGDHAWKYKITFNLIVEYEDNSVVASFTNDNQYLLNFKTLDADGKYRLRLTIVDPARDPTVEDIHIDLVDLRPTNYYGIYRTYKNGFCIIKNGTIKQGRGGSFRGHAIFNYDSDYMIIEDIILESWGLETTCFRSLYSDNCTILRSSVINYNPHVFNRMQLSAAVDMVYCQYCNIYDNTIMSDTGWGCIYLGGAGNSNIYNNILKTKSTITNHHAINAGNDNITIFNNTIEAEPGQGIIVGQSKNIDISNNTITIKKIAPNFEYDCMSLDAIRINDYGEINPDKQARDMKIHDNNIFIRGDFDEYYSFICENLHVNGILTLASGPNNYVSNNYIKVTVVDDNVCASGISPGSGDLNEVIFKIM